MKNSLNDLWDKIKWSNMSNWSPRRKGKRGWTNKIFEEIMNGIFPYLVTYSQIQETQKNPSCINTKKTTSRHFKLLKTKDKETVLKADKEK